jgi:hypothetical protein
MTEIKRYTMLGLALIALVGLVPIVLTPTPAHAVTCTGSAQIIGALVVNVAPASTTTLPFTFTWAGVPNKDIFTISTLPAPAGWTFTVLTKSVNVGANGASGTAPVSISVTAPNVPGASAQMTVTATDGLCTLSVTASLTVSVHTTSVPEFSTTMLVPLALGFALVAIRKRNWKLPSH